MCSLKSYLLLHLLPQPIAHAMYTFKLNGQALIQLRPQSPLPPDFAWLFLFPELPPRRLALFSCRLLDVEDLG